MTTTMRGEMVPADVYDVAVQARDAFRKPKASRWSARSRRPAENRIASLALGGIMVLPLAEIVSRKLFGAAIPGSGAFASNLTLWLGMLGAAIAAREGKLLTLATGEFLPKGRIERRSRTSSPARSAR